MTYPWIIRRQFSEKFETIVDVGCGKGGLMAAVRPSEKHPPFVIGLDIFTPYLEICKTQGSHDELIRADVRHLPLRNHSVDIVLCSQVLEHVPKRDGASLIAELTRVTWQRTIVATPVGFIPFLPLDPTDEVRNPFNEHKAGWTTTELERLGFRIVGQGLRAIYGEHGLARRMPRRLRVVGYLVSYLAQPFVYFVPNLAIYMIGVKPNSSGGL
jgi:ubiquinone/menaquinone biosynthesis C-methylase UbiE